MDVKARKLTDLEQAVEALRAWQKFWDAMPKGELGKISCDIGLLNDAFLMTSAVLRKHTAPMGHEHG